MNIVPRQTLRQILAKYGKEICSDARRCEALLNDLCGSHRREINVLVNAIEENVPLDLLAGAGSTPLELLLTRIEKRLEDQTALTAEAARWAVESWALALGFATDADIKARERKQSVQPSTKIEPIPPTEPENAPTIPNALNVNRANPTQTSKIQRQAPQSRNTPTNPPQVNKKPNSLPPVYLPTNPQYQPSNSAVAPQNRFGIFRGCLLAIFLLAITSVLLFLGVPYAIEVMRETQRERNNEPPRFPNR